MRYIPRSCRKCGLDKPHYPSQKYKCIDCLKAEPSQSAAKRKERAKVRAERETVLDRVARQKYMKAWREDNVDKIKEYRLKNKKRNRDNYRKWCLKNKYGITLVEYENLLVKQNNRCAICDIKEPPTGWHVDHCHITGIVRGLLCTNCNPMLGFAKDNPKILRAAANYLEGKK